MSTSPGRRARRRNEAALAHTQQSGVSLAVTTGQAPDATPSVTAPASLLGRATGATRRWLTGGDWTIWGLLLIALVGLALRLYGINWDVNTHLHPDEREIVFRSMCLNFPGQPRGSDCPGAISTPGWFFSRKSPLNPHFFAYGAFPLYLLAAVAHGLAWLTQATSGAFHPTDGGAFDDYNHFTLVGRALSTLFDTGSIVLAGLIARRLGGRWAGLLAAAFVAVLPFEVQVAHFYAVDTPTLSFILLTLWACVALAQRASHPMPVTTGLTRREALRAITRESLKLWLLGVVAGVGLALAVASKVSALPLLAPMLLAAILCWRRRNLESAALVVAGMVASAILTFILTSPYTLIDWYTFYVQVNEQTALSQGTLDYPYVRQFANTTPYLYQLQQLLFYDMGVPLGALGLAGVGWAISRFWRRWDDDWTILLAWILPYFVVIGDAYMKFSRYMLPVYAPLAICGACALVALVGWARGRGSAATDVVGGLRLARWAPGVCVALGLVALLATTLNALAIDAIYSAPNTRIQASEWIYNHVPARSVITSEVWDDSLPLVIPSAKHGTSGQAETADGHLIDPGQYGSVGLNLYDADTPQKASELATSLANANVVVIASQRLLLSIPKLPDRYPMTIRYYQLLFAGKLGFHLAAHFATAPHLGPLTYGDAGADESFSVYDHPPVWIFVRSGESMSNADLYNALTTGIHFQQASSRSGSQKALLLSQQNAAADAQSPTFAQQFAADSVANRAPLAWWLALVELLGLISFPLTFAAFRGLRDRGWGFSKLVGLLLVAWLVWFPSSLRVLPFDRWAVALACVVVAVASGALAWRMRREFTLFLATRWRLLAINEALFLAAFLAFTWIRALDPDLWHIYRGGEKPMELAFLDAILRSRYMPPLDPWFAGGAINYYYYGQYLAAVLIKLSGVVPTTAFNLMIPMLFALSISGAFSVVAGITRRAWAGAAGGIALVVVSNLDGLSQTITNTAATLHGLQPALFDYWASTRVIPYTINEFPFWSFLYADLHAHVIDLPIVVLIVGLATSLLGRARRDGGRWRVVLPTLALAALALGATWLVNTWDFPTCALLLVVTFSLRLIPFGSRQAWTWAQIDWRVTRAWGVAVGATLAAAYALYLPFHATFQNFTSGIGAVTTPTDPRQFFILFGIWLFLIVSFLAVELTDRLRRDVLPTLAKSGDTFLLEPVALWLIAGSLVAALGLASFMSLKVALVLLLALTLLLGLDRNHSPARLLTYILIALGLAIAFGVELVYVRDFLDLSAWERMNTVFKFYYQVWIYFALGGALAFSFLSRRVADPRGLMAAFGAGATVDMGDMDDEFISLEPHPTGAFPRIVWLLALTGLLGASLIFDLQGTRVRIEDPTVWAAVQPPPGGVQPTGLTLDGMAYMRGWYPEDYAAINWMNAHVRGAPTIVEASGNPYMWYSRVSIYTGLPDVIGWANHESQQRYPDQAFARQAAVSNFYATANTGEALSFLSDYHVSYVYLGQMERACYTTDGANNCVALPRAALDKFQTLSQMGALRPVFVDGATVIYEVVGQ